MTEAERKQLIDHLDLLQSKGIFDNDCRLDEIPQPCTYFGSEESAHDENAIDNPFFSEERDWKEFWEICKEYYPLHSIAGSNTLYSKEKIIENEKNEMKLILHELGLTDLLEYKNVLEIGFGFCGAGKYLTEECNANYDGIDYTFSDENDRYYSYCGKEVFHEINISGIPEELKNKNYDLIFSTNVFQHITEEQRHNYINEAYQLLNNGGILYFDEFVKNRVREFPQGYATNFFTVKTKVNTRSEILEFLNSVGFSEVKVVNVLRINNTTSQIRIKCVK